ncbi:MULTISPECIES: hypothetical protein [Aphanizomenon]|uniref:hypothetical protein n=1 Tax=Aphanizomenon TaxID=1175 RepID=UPI000542CF83|nr:MULTISPECIES: hypothetical protein [Aphanizomenon]KHG42705.1 hypothetical protein OA07_03450 [Aphanizomenon flos-aquae 2012/KM1/D3]MTJ30732.1 hypothetical protein [Aphanizomenon sp. UHCC 0183]QSV69361.1 MAG: hypothetical protein HEQ20_07930 [Aphanizomenon flos-aquae KM1D3_PB]
MLEKLISLSETEDQILQKISDNLGISEENLIRQVLTDFLARQADELNEQTWLDAVTNNPSLAFLHDPEEDIYNLKDGQPVAHEG